MASVLSIKKMTIHGPGYSDTTFSLHFTDLEDPRRSSKGNFIYPLEEILFLSISASICGCKEWTSIEEFGNLKLEWLQQFYPYKNGVPSHDSLGKLFASLDQKRFNGCFTKWVNSIAKNHKSDVIPIDGKTIRGVASKHGKAPLHIVTAFCSKNSVSLGQQIVDDKSNEIVAIPKLLDSIVIKGCIITIDAMGCQKKIAEKISEKEADYILQVKGNQKKLSEEIIRHFETGKQKQDHVSLDSGHGRIEVRRCEIISDLSNFEGKENWKNLNSVIRIESVRTEKSTDYTSKEFRYYISSLQTNAELINNSIRNHWSIENKLHWSLDVIFNEDGQLKRNGNSATNYNTIAKAAIALLDNEKSQKKSKPLKMLKATLSDKYREKIMKV